ncbi:hypothetical protein [Eisenbergiella sp.]
MSIRFTEDDWARMKETYGKWWNQTLDRPIIKATLQKEVHGQGDIPLLSQATCHRLDISPEDVIERINAELEQQEYLGDAFPMINFDVFGPGIVAAFLGARLDNSSGNVWFHPTGDMELKDMHYEFQENNVWFCRIKDIYYAAAKKWKGNVLMGMPDLGGVMDILATLRGSENLLYDLYDEPDEVKRVSREIQNIWLRYYQEFADILMQTGPGFTDWTGLFCSEPSYVVQCDFSYMISPDMFREFVAEDLTQLCTHLPRTLYHLDGKGELPHLPQLLQIQQLDAVQWCPGDGAPRPMEWMDVYGQIRQSGKNMHILGDETDFRAIAGEVGAKGLYFNAGLRPYSQQQSMMQLLSEFQAIE